MASGSWGTVSWGQNQWNDTSDPTFTVTGIALTASLGDETTVGEINVGWGRLAWNDSAWGIAGNLIAPGQALTGTLASVVASIDVSTSVTGSSASTSIGGNVISINQTMSPTGLSLTSSIGVADAAPDALAVGQSLTTSIGNVTAEGVIEIGWGGDAWGLNQWGELNAPTEAVTTAGLLQTSAGSSTITGNADIDVTGTALTISQGEDISGTSHLSLIHI